jgi:L-ascorbate metabolism protein UlaG (beta-lactamase superfamily)
MRIRLIRHATLIVEYAGHTFLVDPMLDAKDARPAIQNSPNEHRNPLVDLPVDSQGFLGKAEAVLVTHTHSDHWDSSAEKILAKDLPLFGQPQDENKFQAAGFTSVRPIQKSVVWNEIEISRTGGQHGTGEIAKKMAPVSGFVLKGEGEATLYIAGDTIWCSAVQDALDLYEPDVIVVNAGAARFLEGNPITMSAGDVITVCRRAPGARLIAVHMEAINHCLLTRVDLAAALQPAGMGERVAIPADGESLYFPMR